MRWSHRLLIAGYLDERGIRVVARGQLPVGQSLNFLRPQFVTHQMSVVWRHECVGVELGAQLDLSGVLGSLR